MTSLSDRMSGENAVVQSGDTGKQGTTLHRPLIISTFVRELQEWGEKSTLHGVPAIFSRKSGILRRLFWISIIGAAAYGLYFGYYIQIQRYLKYRTVTKDTLRHEDTLPFPAITICNTCILRNNSFDDETERQLLLDIFAQTNATNLLDKYDKEYLSKFKLSELFIKHAVPEKEIFYACIWDSHHNFSCLEHVHGHMVNGKYCYTINGHEEKHLESSSVGAGHGLYMVMFANQENYFISEYASAGFTDKLMTPPVKALGTSECLDTRAPNFQNPLKHYKSYSYSACEMECMVYFIHDICGCVNPVHPGLMRECDPMETVSCSFPARDRFYRNSSANIKRCGCLIPCEFTRFQTKVSFAYFPNSNYLRQHADSMKGQMQDLDYVRANYLSVNIFYETKVVETREQILEFPKFDLIASLSGYLGLAVGASVLTFIEFFELFFIALSKLVARR